MHGQLPATLPTRLARARKDITEAVGWYRKALSADADCLEVLSNLGAVLIEDGQADAAAPPLIRALQLHPDHPEALCNLGMVRLSQNRSDEAEALLQRALHLRPRHAEAILGLARIWQENGQPQRAVTILADAVEHEPLRPDLWCQLGAVHMELDQPGKAEQAWRRALGIDSATTDALIGLGSLSLENGDMAEAENCFQGAITADPGNIAALFHLVQARKVRPDDPALAALETIARGTGHLASDKRISLHYALGKAYDDLREWDKAFPHFLEGARLKRQKIRFNAEEDAATTNRIAQIVDCDFIDRLSGAGNMSDTPVFVLGMPRSGTTLTEQIIASHPDVFGAGEVPHLLDALQQPKIATGAGGFPGNITALTRENAAEWGESYVARLREHAPNARRITVKMPANYLVMGLIPVILPNAKIIHVKRNPVDTCLSCFTRLFNRHQAATYDLAELGRHYANYAHLMDHWRAILPASAFLEVEYENIVNDMEGQARRLIEWVGLEWNDACLGFHKTKRTVRTASLTQVRQPIYGSSVERWRNYEQYLGPLLEQLSA